MSTLNSFFNTRKSKGTVSADNTTTLAIQAPIQTPLKPLKTQTKQKPKPKKNTILYYLKPTPPTEEHVVCQVRRTMPISTILNIILEEFDSECEIIEPQPDTKLLSPVVNNQKKRKLPENQMKLTRNGRLRTTGCIEFTKIEDYLLDDLEEDLSRPVRTKQTLKESNLCLLHIMDEFLELSDNSLFELK